MKKKMFVFCTLVAGVSFMFLEPILAGSSPPVFGSGGDLGKPSDYNNTIKDFPAAGGLNPVFDYRYVQNRVSLITTAKDQRACGSCWAFATVAVLESKVRDYAHNWPITCSTNICSVAKSDTTYNGFATKPDISEEQQVVLNSSQSGCSGGRLNALKFYNNNGPMMESCTGYTASSGTTAKNRLNSLHCDEELISGENYFTVNMGDRNLVKGALVLKGPLSFRFDTYDDFHYYWWQMDEYGWLNVPVYKKGRNGSTARSGAHAVQLIGWDDNKGAWIMKNSWGRTGGPNNNGIFYMAYTGHTSNLNFGAAGLEFIQEHECQSGDQYCYSSSKIVTCDSDRFWNDPVTCPSGQCRGDHCCQACNGTCCETDYDGCCTTCVPAGADCP